MFFYLYSLGMTPPEIGPGFTQWRVALAIIVTGIVVPRFENLENALDLQEEGLVVVEGILNLM